MGAYFWLFLCHSARWMRQVHSQTKEALRRRGRNRSCRGHQAQSRLMAQQCCYFGGIAYLGASSVFMSTVTEHNTAGPLLGR